MHVMHIRKYSCHEEKTTTVHLVTDKDFFFFHGLIKWS